MNLQASRLLQPPLTEVAFNPPSPESVGAIAADVTSPDRPRFHEPEPGRYLYQLPPVLSHSLQCLGFLLLSAFLLLFSACQPQGQALGNQDLSRADIDTLSSLASVWHSGEAVALIRHTERCDRSPSTCVEGDSGITEAGQAAARDLGAGFRTLSLDAAIVYSSPERRATQTAEAAFGTGVEVRDWLRECRSGIRPNLFENKVPGVNLILLTHSSCMEQFDSPAGELQQDLDYMDPDTYGAVIFLRLDTARRKVSVLGYLKAADWAPFMARLAMLPEVSVSDGRAAEPGRLARASVGRRAARSR